VVAYFILTSIFTALFFTSFGFGGLALIIALPTVIAGLLYAGYDFYMHHYRNGQTLGKLVMKTRLVAPDGGKPDQITLLKRAAIYPGVTAVVGLLGFIDVFGNLLGLVVAVFTLVDGIFVFTDLPLRRALHDKWAGTLVIKAQ
jgi:uncharacterized RDD family membrane protein YckC